ncbi:alpha/beta-hydrolase [Aspergillus heteromorphus CBS 117.55]|uniref:Alpha/beta-hydrolase n=1 Tax=Aspergillus heteromorphus CBS 117.55 TaxID=1448321 RepID=A0A317X4V8_9EURO|nr:alpha/beta-hydrolase [Aspergillus heteromorphus CBS 117.55]PWY92642.1 alpha/beta-hydrolase [Aspergillus heteromorphus CBS 117.55]
MIAASYLLLALSATSWALPSPAAAACRDINIPVTVAAPRFLINTTIDNDWDAAALIFNLTRRDSDTSADPLPIAGSTSTAVEGNYTVGATLCGTGETILVLTHGIIESKLYWDPTFPNAENYSFVDAAVAAGYSVLNYDRIGVGSSSKINALYDAQFQVETAVLNTLVSYARSLPHTTKVALIGHSYGAYLSAASASQTAVDALVLTGFSGTFDYFGPFLAGSSLRVAKTQDPTRWGSLDPAYLISADQYAEAYIYFAEPYFEQSVARWAYEVSSEPFAVGELPSLMATTIDFSNITAPVYILQGQFDLSACGGNCVGLINATADTFNGSEVVEWVDDLPAGHSLNLHRVAPTAFQMVFEFLGRQGV